MSFLKSAPFIIIRNVSRVSNPLKSIPQPPESNISSSASLHLMGSYNRKEKSLEELSRKFLQMFLYSNETYISLDKITEFLGVERRRIYDIINILESLNLVTRKGKNNYRWNGFHRVYETIHSFEGLEINEIKGLSFSNLPIKREKSLKLLSIGFLGLFFRWKATMSLEEAAKSLSEGLKAEDHKIKTKIRRLYDIANVFKSLGLIKKTVLGNKKPAFHWVGIKGLDEFVESNHKEKNHIKETEEEDQKKNSETYDRDFLVKCLMSLLENKTNNNSQETTLQPEKSFNIMDGLLSQSQESHFQQNHMNLQQQSFVTPTIKRTLTIIYPKTDDTQTPNSLEHSQLKREVSKEFEGFSLKDCSNELKRKPLMSLSQGLDISRKSSFKKIKRCEDDAENKENLRPIINS